MIYRASKLFLACLSLFLVSVKCVATPPAEALHFINPGVRVAAEAVSCDGAAIDTASRPSVTGTNVNLQFKVIAEAEVTTPPASSELLKYVNVKKVIVTFIDSKNKTETIEQTLDTELTIWDTVTGTSGQVTYDKKQTAQSQSATSQHLLNIRFASTHFANGPLSISIEADVKVAYGTGDGAFTPMTTPANIYTLNVYNKALVFATKERACGPNNSYMATDDGAVPAKETAVARDGAERAKTVLKSSEVNHIILNEGTPSSEGNPGTPGIDLQEYLKADVLSSLKEATMLLPVTHGLVDSRDRASGIRPSHGQLLYSALGDNNTPPNRAPTADESSQYASECISLSDIKNAIFTGRTAPNKVNLALMFCCNLGNFNTQTVVSDVFGIRDFQNNADENSVDQACLIYRGTLFADSNQDPATTNPVTIATYIEELLNELKGGETIEAARDKLAKYPKYNWMNLKNCVILRGDMLTKLSYVYIKRNEQSTATTYKAQWYKL